MSSPSLCGTCTPSTRSLSDSWITTGKDVLDAVVPGWCFSCTSSISGSVNQSAHVYTLFEDGRRAALQVRATPSQGIIESQGSSSRAQESLVALSFLGPLTMTTCSFVQFDQNNILNYFGLHCMFGRNLVVRKLRSREMNSGIALWTPSALTY